MGKYVTALERKSWHELEFNKLVLEKGWHGEARKIAFDAFFAGASKRGVHIQEKKIGERYDRRRKMTSEDKQAALLAWTNGESVASIAKRYGVSGTTIYYIINPYLYERANNRAAEYSRSRGDDEKKESCRRYYEYKRRLALEAKI